MRTDRWAIEAQTGITYVAVALLVTFHKLLFQPQAFSLSLYEKFCLHSLTKFVQKRDFKQLCIGQIETSTSPPPPPSEHTPGIWLSESSRGWKFELHPQFHVKSLAWWAVVGDVVLEDFPGKYCAFEANWLWVLCRIWRYLNFNIFNIGFSLWINECIKLCL